MSTTRGRLRRPIMIAAATCVAAFATAPSAIAAPTGVGPVDTVINSLSGGVQTPHPYICDERRAEVQFVIQGVRDSLSNSFPDITTMAARGYAPYVDAPLFGLSGRQGHWLNPGFVGDVYPAGHAKAGQPRLMDPQHPEGILVDRWNRPIGVMFIADDPHVPGPDMYIDSDSGESCNAWHYHTETLADAYWYAYKYGWSGDTQNGNVIPPDRTPDLMHVWRYGDYQYQWQHNAPPQNQMPGDPASAEDARGIVGGPRLPGTPPNR